MVNDANRELLMWAAKAAGIWDETDPSNGMLKLTGQYWNPITDDGDAFRLVVKLNLKVMCRTHSVAVMSEDGEVRCLETYYQDPLTATRRAIVRAAAEIGRNMK